MVGFRDRSISWRAVLKRKTPYAPEQTASRAQGHRVSQLIPADLQSFFVTVNAAGLADMRQRVSVEHGIDPVILSLVRPHLLVLTDLESFDAIMMSIEHTMDVRPGAKATEIALIQLKRGKDSIFIAHAPGETVVQKRRPL